jgi:hypothetical protein
MVRCTFKSFCVSITFLLAVSLPALAQGIARGSGEASGTFGYAHVNGVTSYNHFVLGGSAFYNINQYFAAGFEYKYTPLGSETIGGVNGTEHLQTYGGAARFAFSGSGRAVPYAVVGFGAVDEKAIASYQGVSESASQGGYYVSFGGGATIFGGQNWGVRPEFRFERQQFDGTSVGGLPVAAFGQNDVQGTVSVFYQFGGKRN